MPEPFHYVILSVDTTADEYSDSEALRMPKVGTWTQTEGDEQYEYDYLAEESGDESYRDGKHRKYVATLTTEEFEEWLASESWDREDAEPTMGMLTDLGWLPAYALRDDPMGWNVGGVTYVIDRRAYVGEYALASKSEIPSDARERLLELY